MNVLNIDTSSLTPEQRGMLMALLPALTGAIKPIVTELVNAEPPPHPTMIHVDDLAEKITEVIDYDAITRRMRDTYDPNDYLDFDEVRATARATAREVVDEEARAAAREEAQEIISEIPTESDVRRIVHEAISQHHSNP